MGRRAVRWPLLGIALAALVVAALRRLPIAADNASLRWGADVDETPAEIAHLPDPPSVPARAIERPTRSAG